MAKVVCLGVAVVDAIFTVPHIPKEPVKVMARAFREVGGGMAATGAVAICRLGGEATIWGRLGDDDIASRVVAGLEAEGVHRVVAGVDEPVGAAGLVGGPVEAPEGMTVALYDDTLIESVPVSLDADAWGRLYVTESDRVNGGAEDNRFRAFWLEDDLAATTFWYQTLPTAPFPELPGRDELEVI